MFGFALDTVYAQLNFGMNGVIVLVVAVPFLNIIPTIHIQQHHPYQIATIQKEKAHTDVAGKIEIKRKRTHKTQSNRENIRRERENFGFFFFETKRNAMGWI